MCNSRMALKYKTGSGLLFWIRSRLNGSMGTRHTRLTWEGLKERGTLKVQVKVPGGSFKDLEQNDRLSRIKSSTGEAGLELEKPNVYTKTDINGTESKAILQELLTGIWKSTCTVASSGKLDQKFLLRWNPEIGEKKVIVEFGSPNIAKPLHMGHLRSTVTGHYVARMCTAAGHDVTNICFLGDWGTQFGILQAGLKQFTSPERTAVSIAEKLSLPELLEVYVKSVQKKGSSEDFSNESLKCSADLEKGNEEAVKVWRIIRDKTIAHLTSFWNLFGIKYDVIQGESEFTVDSSHTEKAMKLLSDVGGTEVGPDNRTYVLLPPDKKFSKVLKVPVVKSDGSSLYLLRDIACCLLRMEKFKFHHMLYVVDKTQVHHFVALFRIVGLVEEEVQSRLYDEHEWEKKLMHITFGKVAGMSTRSGNFVLLSDVIEYGASLMQENRRASPHTRNPEDYNVATRLAISALVINSLKTRRNRDVEFDWNKALKPTGETGVNLQYTHARLCSLHNKVGNRFPSIEDKSELKFDTEYIMEDPVALELAVHLVNFEDAFWSSYSEMEPCVLVAYLFKLTDKISKALKELKVVSEPNDRIALSRFLLFETSRSVLAAGLHIVGVTPLQEI